LDGAGQGLRGASGQASFLFCSFRLCLRACPDASPRAGRSLFCPPTPTRFIIIRPPALFGLRCFVRSDPGLPSVIGSAGECQKTGTEPGPLALTGTALLCSFSLFLFSWPVSGSPARSASGDRPSAQSIRFLCLFARTVCHRTLHASGPPDTGPGFPSVVGGQNPSGRTGPLPRPAGRILTAWQSEACQFVLRDSAAKICRSGGAGKSVHTAPLARFPRQWRVSGWRRAPTPPQPLTRHCLPGLFCFSFFYRRSAGKPRPIQWVG
jgi:hypothetical protein